MMTDTRAETIRCARGKGMALLTVLLIIMAITVISLGFLSRSDVELACGQNMLLRFQMDQLAHSALDHARGLLLNPQEVPSEYWAGAANLQLLAGSADYYKRAHWNNPRSLEEQASKMRQREVPDEEIEAGIQKRFIAPLVEKMEREWKAG